MGEHEPIRSINPNSSTSTCIPMVRKTARPNSREVFGREPPAVARAFSYTTPSAIALDFQTGVAADTLVFGQIRHVKWSEFTVTPDFFGTAVAADGLVSLDDTTTYTLGVGRKFTDNWSGSLAFTFEPEGDDDLVSPLAPTNGRKAITVAGIYTMDNWKFTGGINYTKLGDAKAEVGDDPDTAVADMEDNDAISLGLRVGYRF